MAAGKRPGGDVGESSELPSMGAGTDASDDVTPNYKPGNHGQVLLWKAQAGYG